MLYARNFIAILAGLGIAAGPSIAAAQIAFTDVTDVSGAGHFSESYGASWGDLDGDGYLDLFTSNHRTQPSLFLNMGAGTFVDVGAQTLDWQNRPHADTHGGSWADYNNDGQQDLMISTGTGNLSQFLVNQNQRLVDLTVPLGLGITNLGGRLPVWLDYDKDHRLDVVVTQYGGVAKLFHQKADGTFIDATTTVKLLCKRFHYAQLLDVNNDGQVDFVCPDETLFPQKVYDFKPFPYWKKLFDSATPASFFPLVHSVADSAIADFNNDGLMDVFVLGGVQLRPSSVVQSSDPKHFEAMLAGGSKGAQWVTTGAVTFKMDWNKAADDGAGTDITKVRIGALGRHPTSSTFILDPNTDSSVAGMPPAPDANTVLPVLDIGYDPALNQWTMTVVTKLVNGVPIFSQGYFEVTSTSPITGLKATGLWLGDLPAAPTLLMNNGGSFVDNTANSGLSGPVQCVSVTPGDFDNDMWVDLYLACRTGASNIANILYHNNGNGTFTAVPFAGGAAGPVGLAIADGAGTADSVVSADYDVDGFLDLYVTNGFNLRPLYIGGPNKLYHNNGNNGNHWIELDLVGVNSDRDATGAIITATANGVTQTRVQNGAYHRWSQDAKRAHFGLASATGVSLHVVWPSGATGDYSNVAADQLYRITEGSRTAVPVALGIAPAYQCGPPPLNGATDSGVFIWRDCPSGEWRMKTAGGGVTVTYSGTVTSSAAYTSVAGVGLTADDSLDYTSNPSQIVFSFKTIGKSTDGVNFVPHAGASACLQITAPGLLQVYLGPFRVPVSQPFDLETQAACP